MRPGALLPCSGGGSGSGLEGSLLKAAREQGLSGRRLAEAVAAAVKLPRRQVYQAYLALKEQGRWNRSDQQSAFSYQQDQRLAKARAMQAAKKDDLAGRPYDR